MKKVVNVQKEKFIANISPLVIYIASVTMFALSIISCELLYEAEKSARTLWAVLAITVSVLDWGTAVIGFYSYLYAFKYDVKKSIVYVAVCYVILIIGVVLFYLVFKLLP
jgi:hypothetical protein